MANKGLFGSATRGKIAQAADTTNKAGGLAFSMPPRHALAQVTCTGTLGDGYYSSAVEQLDTVLALLKQIAAEPDGLGYVFIAKTAIYARERGYMKDLPALICAWLTTQDVAVARGLLRTIFPVVIDNGKMLRNFVQIIRSGAVGRKSLGSLPRKLVQQWFTSRPAEQVFRQSVGDAPSLGDIIKLCRVSPADDERRALHGYLIGETPGATKQVGKGRVAFAENVLERATYDASFLPPLVRDYEAFKSNPTGKPVPRVPWEMLAGLSLDAAQWRELAMRSSWTQIRMNLNTYMRHGVFEDVEATQAIARKLADPEAISGARPFPYQLLNTYINIDPGVPHIVREALQDALERSVEFVPVHSGPAFVFPDHSGSMDAAVTGARKGATSKVTCKMVAALISSIFLRRNPHTEVIPFADDISRVQLNPRDSIMTNAQILGRLPSGGTNCSAPLRAVNGRRAKADLVVYVSDNESWLDTGSGVYRPRSTQMLVEWRAFQQRNPKAKLVCIDLVPNTTTQAPTGDPSILNIGGFSDAVFETIARFVDGSLTDQQWVGIIDAVSLPA